jgi:hypothetical protein
MTIEITDLARVLPMQPADVPTDDGRVDPDTRTDTDGMTYTGPFPVLDRDGQPVLVYRADYAPGMAPWVQHPECDVCKAMRDPALRYGPAHEIRDRCQSGRRPHCTCPLCWG